MNSISTKLQTFDGGSIPPGVSIHQLSRLNRSKNVAREVAL